MKQYAQQLLRYPNMGIPLDFSKLSLSETLSPVIAKSGGSPVPRNGRVCARVYFLSSSRT